MRPHYNNQKWTTAKFKSFVISALRATSRKWPPRYLALQDAFVGQKINSKSKRLSKHYKCAACNEDVPTSEIQIDHILPIIDPTKGFTTWDDFIERLFCEKDNLQALCKPCHTIKTNKEKDESKERTRT